ncbi:DUF721 domain-containing protein [Kitasatospora sp. GP82]|uniref:DUF721 domain-containing protein n=1 Tax=Kitasatospora sp. GP82 TaxID=3035089 RepID=UPI00247595AA|nr:DUF721 domain-containing protein [Kitasatospora sp. GP82]MDH6130067.1 hypothetical protein [Kitasatospora sp. GP82]
MSLSTPGWFAALDSWWLPAVGEDIARNVSPLGLDGQGRLHVACHSGAWRRQVRLLERPLTARVNRCLPAAPLTGINVVHGTEQR